MLSWLMLVAAMLVNSAPPAPHIVLITIDGTRYQEVFEGTDPHFNNGPAMSARELVPNLYSYFVDHGVAVGKATPMTASGPNFISLPGYLEITRGHPSTDCQRNDCFPVIDQSILQFYTSPAVFASWNIISRTLPAHYSGYVNVGQPKYRWDPQTEVAVKDYLKDHHPDFLWVSLGDTDELAHRKDYAGYLLALHEADAFIGDLIKTSDPNTVFVVTVDHGRNANFKDHGRNRRSQRVWCMLYGKDIPELGFVKTDHVTLSSIYPTLLSIQLRAQALGLGTQFPDSILARIQ